LRKRKRGRGGGIEEGGDGELKRGGIEEGERVE
jgi:hypothetical protein